MKITNSIDLELNRDKQVNVQSIRCDMNSRFVRLNLCHNRSPININGMRACIMAVKPDGKEIFNDCKVINAEKGIIEFEITKQMGILVGEVECQIKLFGPDQLLSSNIFKLVVTKTLSPSSESSKDQLEVLVNALGQVQNIDNRFNEINAQLSIISNRTIEVNARDFGAVGDGVFDDTEAFNKMISFINSNKDEINKIVVPTGAYKITKPIVFDKLKNINISIEGVIVSSSSTVCLEFYFCESCNVFINMLKGVETSDYEQLICDGVKFTNCRFMDFNVNTIWGFKDAIRLDAVDLRPSIELRGTYNLTIKFEHLKGCYTGIHILKTTDTAWINENRFIGGSISSQYSIIQGSESATTLTPSSQYNRNIFELIAFEQVKSDAVVMYEANSCVVRSCRPENPRTIGNYIIKEGVCPQRNLYDFGLSSIELNLVQLNLTNFGSTLIGELRYNTSVVGKKVSVVKNEKKYEADFITHENLNNIIAFADNEENDNYHLLKYKDRDGKTRKYIRLNRPSYTLTENDVATGISIPTTPLSYTRWVDDRIWLKGRLQTQSVIPRQTDITPNLSLDRLLKPSTSTTINCVAYKYSTGESCPVVLMVASDGKLITQTEIPSGYLINIDNFIADSRYIY